MHDASAGGMDVAWPGIVEAYRAWLPVGDEEPVTLGEGNTPLLPAEGLRRLLPSGRHPPALFLKLEGCNPTGSFKDRGMALAVTRARARGARALVCASTGNTAAAAAAYAARAGLRCLLVLPGGDGVAAGKLAQAAACGARVLRLRGNFDRALELVREAVAARPELVWVNSVNPDRLHGQQTAAFEVVEQLAAAGAGEPAAVFLPVGNGGNVTAYAMGFVAWQAAGRLRRVPRLYGVQAEGAAPLVRGEPVAEPATFASAIRIGRPAYGAQAMAAVRASGGRILAVADEEIAAAQRLLAQVEGVFAEPASAASVAGLLRAAREGLLAAEGPVVCVLTGHGLKDPDAVLRAVPELAGEALPPEAARDALLRLAGEEGAA